MGGLDESGLKEQNGTEDQLATEDESELSYQNEEVLDGEDDSEQAEPSESELDEDDLSEEESIDDRINKNIDCEEDEVRYQEWKTLPRSTFEDMNRSALLKMVGNRVEREIDRLDIQSIPWPGAVWFKIPSDRLNQCFADSE